MKKGPTGEEDRGPEQNKVSRLSLFGVHRNHALTSASFIQNVEKIAINPRTKARLPRSDTILESFDRLLKRFHWMFAQLRELVELESFEGSVPFVWLWLSSLLPGEPRTPRRVLIKQPKESIMNSTRQRCAAYCRSRFLQPIGRALEFAFLVGMCATGLMAPKAHAAAKPKFQYESGDIRVSLPSAEEPRVAKFGPASLKAAAKYLEDGAVCWVREKSCVNCHTTGPYMTERTAWVRQFGKPSDEVLADFVDSVPPEIKPVKESDKNGHKFYPGTFSSVWRALGLAEWDRHLNGKTSEPTERALRDMFSRQSASGAFVSHGEVEIPHITTDFELTLQAARAITAAPGWLAGPKDESLAAGVAKMKDWLRSSAPKNDFDRILKLQLAHYLPELVPRKERDAAMALLSSKQHADGGWCVRDMSALDDWHFEISDAVRNLITNLADAAKPQSDAYMTSLAIVLMRQGNVPVVDPRIQRGLAWLKREQRESGRWWMQSLYRGNYHYITYIATAQAMKALDLCGELEAVSGN